MGVKIPKKTYVTLPEDTYIGDIEVVETVTGDYGEQVKFYFSLPEIEDDVSLVGWCSASYSDKSKLFSWAKAALGPDFDPNEDFDSDKLIGRRVMLDVSKRLSTSGTEFNRIESLIKYKAPAPVKKKAVVVEEETNW